MAQTMAKYLVVANQTLGCDELVAKLDELTRAGDCAFRLAVPVTDTEGQHQWDYPPIDRVIPDAHKIARALAEGRLEHELARLQHAGVTADGEVVDAAPVNRIRELVDAETYEGVIICTLPGRLSRWLRGGLPHRISRAVTVPVIHVAGSAGPSL